MAQLVERLVRNEKAAGSNPTISTKNNRSVYRVGYFYIKFSCGFDYHSHIKASYSRKARYHAAKPS